MILSRKFIRNKWLYANLNGALIGVGVGIIINFFAIVFSAKPISWEKASIQMMFSIFISICISNIILFNYYLLSKTFKRTWVAVIAYYAASLIGMTVGHELSHLVMSVIYHYDYQIGTHLTDLFYSLTITVIVCTILFAYEAQKGRYDQKLQQQELEVLKLKQLKTQAELQTLQSKINPHFLYNALNSIAGLIHDDADKAEDMTIKLSRLFRYSINAP
ncbi:MAG: Two-component sensor histidine kinase, partial [Daejeonella sp.]|nr:Two-component sensor histidine kinase [Daejeonella sp.]